MTIKQRYKKERNRILSFIRRNKKEGYNFPTFVMPSIPKKITEASIRKLQRFTTKKLYDYAEWIDLRTGEIRSGRCTNKSIMFQEAKDEEKSVTYLHEFYKEFKETKQAIKVVMNYVTSKIKKHGLIKVANIIRSCRYTFGKFKSNQETDIYHYLARYEEWLEVG